MANSSPRPSVSTGFHPISHLTQQMSSLNEYDGEAEDENVSRAGSRKPSSRMSVLYSPSKNMSPRSNDSCTIRHMKVKERSCSERSDSGFSECIVHNSSTCACLKRQENVVKEMLQKSKAQVNYDSPPLNHKLLKNKLERIASLRSETNEFTEKTRSSEVSSAFTGTPSESALGEQRVSPVGTDNTDAQLAIVAEQQSVSTLNLPPAVNIKSDLDYDIKRYNLDGSSVRLRKKSLENQVKKELTVASTPPVHIKVSNRVSDLKSRFDSAPIVPAVIAAQKEGRLKAKPSHVSTTKIILDRGSTNNGIVQSV